MHPNLFTDQLQEFTLGVVEVDYLDVHLIMVELEDQEEEHQVLKIQEQVQRETV